MATARRWSLILLPQFARIPSPKWCLAVGNRFWQGDCLKPAADQDQSGQNHNRPAGPRVRVPPRPRRHNARLHRGADRGRPAVPAPVYAKHLKPSSAVSDFMVPHPVCAELWQPLGSLRETMFANAFCYLPVNTSPGEPDGWALVSELALESYLRLVLPAQRPDRLREPLAEAIESGLELSPAILCEPGDALAAVIEGWDGCPVLVLDEGQVALVGILTSYDLLCRYRDRSEAGHPRDRRTAALAAGLCG